MAFEHGIEIHLLEVRSPVLHRPAGDHLEVVDQLLGALPPVALDEPDDHVGAALLAAATLAQHGVGLADPGGGTQVDAEPSGRPSTDSTGTGSA